MNKVETFNKFNQGQRRPDRRRHLELCGFKRTKEFYSVLEEGKPSDVAWRHVYFLSDAKDGYYHAITLPRQTKQAKDGDDYLYYEIWTKRL